MRKNTPSKKSPYQLQQEARLSAGMGSYDPMVYVKPQVSESTKPKNTTIVDKKITEKAIAQKQQERKIVTDKIKNNPLLTPEEKQEILLSSQKLDENVHLAYSENQDKMKSFNPEDKPSRAWEYMTNPFTAAEYAISGGGVENMPTDINAMRQAGIDPGVVAGRNIVGNTLNENLNLFDAGDKVVQNTQEGNYLGALGQATRFIPSGVAAKGMLKSVPTEGSSINKKISENFYGGLENYFPVKAKQSGQQWLQDWYEHPIIQKRLIDNAPKEEELLKLENLKENLRQGKIQFDDGTWGNIRKEDAQTVLRNDFLFNEGQVRPNFISPTHYPMQNKSYIDLRKDKGTKAVFDINQNSISTLPNIVSTAGLSYGTPDGIYINRLVHPFENTAKQSTKIHEGTHLLEANGKMFTSKESQILQEPFNINSSEKLNDYFTNPTEIHARMNQIRHALKKSPEDIITLEEIGKLNTKNKLFGMGPYIKDSKKFVDLMNNFYAVPAAIGTGVLLNNNSEQPKQYKQGGPMNSFYASLPGNYYANGGNMEQLTHFNEGGRHEENPLGGIPQGVNPDGQPNLVEEGETKLDSKNYIYSDSLKIDDETAIALQLSKSDIGKTFADISKKMNRSNSRRENDSIEEETKTRDLEALMEAQEVFKQKEIQRKKEEILALDPTAFDQQQPPAQMEPSQNMPPEMGQGQTMGDPMQGQPQIDPAMMQQMSMRLGGNMYNRYDFGGSLGAGVAGVASGIAGSLLPGPLGTMATKGIDTLHGQLDKNITDEERSIAGFGKAAGAIGTGIATGGASLSTGFNDITSGLGQGISNIEGVDPKAAKLINGVAGIAGMVGGEMTDGAGSAEGMAGLSKLIPNSEDVAGMQGMIPFNYGGYLYSTGGILGDPPVKKSTTPTFASQFVTLTPAEEARLRAEKVNQGLTDWNDPNNIVQMSTGDYPQWLKGKSHGASIMPKTVPVTPTLTLPKPPTVGYYTDPNTGQKVNIPNIDPDTGLQLQTNRQMSQGLEGVINTPEAMIQRQTEQNLRKQETETNEGLIKTMSPEDLQRMRERKDTPQEYQKFQFQSAPIKGQSFPTLESPQFNLGGYMKKQNIYANGGPLTQEEYLQQLAIQQQNPFSANYPSMSMDNQALDGNMVMQNPNLEYIEEDQFEPQNEEEAFAQEQAKYEAEKQREAEYESNLQKSGPTGTDQNQNINIKQSPLEYVPLATNLAMGLFSKPQQLEYNDYLSKGKLTAPEMNINPQLSQADQTFAQGQSAVRNAAPGSGAYLSNMQQMANSRNAAYGQLYGQKENIDAQNQMTADQFNIQKEQQDSSTKFAIDDYNAKAKANKFQYLIDAGNQMGQLGSRDAQNQMGLAYGQLLAPDYKGTVSYTPWNPLNKTKV